MANAANVAVSTPVTYPHGTFESSGGLAKSSEPIPFEYSCQVTSGG